MFTETSCISIILKLCLRCYVLFHPQLYLNCIVLIVLVLISFSHGYSATLAAKLIIKLDDLKINQSIDQSIKVEFNMLAWRASLRQTQRHESLYLRQLNALKEALHVPWNV